MNIYELEAFVELAKELHFGKTASKLNMSPSALSRIIARLEEEYSTILIDRNNRQVLLTENGRLFEKFAKEVIEKNNEIKDSFGGGTTEIEGTLPIYASVTACYTILPDFIKIFTEKYPKIHLSVETGDPAGAIAAVRDNNAMVAVAAIPETGVASMETRSVIKTPLVFAAVKDGPYTKLEGSPQDMLSTVPLILPKTGLARSRFDHWIKSRNVKPVIAAETEGNEAILAITRLGLGIGLVPEIVLENGVYKDEFIVHPAGNIMGYYNVGFIWKENFSGTLLTKRIQEAVKKVLNSF